MLLNDPLVEYLDSGGKIQTGFRLRNPVVPQEEEEVQVVQQVEEPTVTPDIGVPTPPLPPPPIDGPSGETIYSNGNTSYRGAQIPQLYDYNSTQDVVSQFDIPQSSIPSYIPQGIPQGNSQGISNQDLSQQTQYGSAFSFDDAIPDLDIRPITFGNNSFIGR